MRPRSTQHLSWRVVPHLTGSLALPALRVASEALQCSVDATAACNLFVMPTHVGQMASVAHAAPLLSARWHL